MNENFGQFFDGIKNDVVLTFTIANHSQPERIIRFSGHRELVAILKEAVAEQIWRIEST